MSEKIDSRMKNCSVQIAQGGKTHAGFPNPAKLDWEKCWSAGHESTNSSQMNMAQKQLSLKRAASKANS
jgi:hypothetical protein